MPTHDEGVIKFAAVHQDGALGSDRYGELACRLIAWREILAKTQLVGQDPARYGGAGYGNVSGRVGAPSSPRGRRAFLVTGTQTGGRDCLTLDDLCVVQSYDGHLNRVESVGRIQPSSESLTHGAIYDLSPRIRYVLHAHSPTIWRRSKKLRIPTTAADIAYGTPEMARAVDGLYRSTSLAGQRILCMGGHEDGVIVFGHTCDEAGQVLITTLARAYELDCASLGFGLCKR